jgi:AcrR family transcriptional regulator
MVRRGYTSAIRDAAARQTKQQLVDVAERLFLEAGYPDTTIAAIAAGAGVSAQTVYNIFGTKAALLKHLYDVRVVGDDEPIPFSERPEMLALRAVTDARELIHGYLKIASMLLGRVGPLVRLIGAGAIAGDRELAEVLATTAGERLTGAGNIAGKLADFGALRPGVSVEEARDVIWTLTGVEVWDLFGRQRGWSDDRLAGWLAHTICDAVL